MKRVLSLLTIVWAVLATGNLFLAAQNPAGKEDTLGKPKWVLLLILFLLVTWIMAVGLQKIWNRLFSKKKAVWVGMWFGGIFGALACIFVWFEWLGMDKPWIGLPLVILSSLAGNGLMYALGAGKRE